ncbi:MAG: YraN family protein [Acidimicrobiales bacterium]
MTGPAAGPRRGEGPSARARRLGVAGEAATARWYEAAGYRVLERNWRCPDGEIDLVCRREGTVVVVEVKTRSTTAYGPPVAAVTAAKQRRLRRLAARWLRERRVRCAVVRFDVAGVTGGRIDVVEGAF